MLGALLLNSCQGADLQGRFSTNTKDWSMQVDSSSPSGTRTVSSSDGIIIFNLKLPVKNTLALGSQFTVVLETDGDIDPLADGTVLTLKANGKTVGTGTLTLVDPSIPNEATALITTTSAVGLKADKSTTFTVITDTSAILAEDAGEDDELTVSVEYNGKKITGSALTY